MTRYPFGSLAALMALSEHQACQQLRISGRTAQEYRRDGMSALVADRLAVRAGFHPAEVWAGWHSDELEAVGRPCDDCGDRFVPARRDGRFCTSRCYRRWWAREVARRRRARPELAERNRERRRAYYAENAEYERARERRRYHEHRKVAA